MENIQKIVNYIQEVLKHSDEREMSPPSTSSGCISGGSEDGFEGLDKLLDSSGNVSAETYLSLPEVCILHRYLWSIIVPIALLKFF